MSTEQLEQLELLPDDLRLLADPSQEVLMDHRPAFSQLAAVPLPELGIDSRVAAEPYRPKARSQG
ncbi:MAG TPA: hypothetical protein VGX49_00885 [Jatrophihabitans sp.]|jgi:hypothetical protein|nr:hypothetical protein [Jatrophihabitans sp.]